MATSLRQSVSVKMEFFIENILEHRKCGKRLFRVRIRNDSNRLSCTLALQGFKFSIIAGMRTHGLPKESQIKSLPETMKLDANELVQIIPLDKLCSLS